MRILRESHRYIVLVKYFFFYFWRKEMNLYNFIYKFFFMIIIIISCKEVRQTFDTIHEFLDAFELKQKMKKKHIILYTLPTKYCNLLSMKRMSFFLFS
jgi:hypothetical protein